MEYRKFFQKATGNPPYNYQMRLAEADPWPDLLEAPTGAGKTEAIVLAWLWRKRYGPAKVRAATPRRLAYTLPMRVLVEQTRDRVQKWLKNLTGLGDLSGFDKVGVEILMGGETDNDWDLHPEREAVLIGTQDMLLSRALNRGYALGRARWPMPYGLLNNDCLWVFDEVQLMGSGLATTAQLAAFREKFQTWGNVPSLWVSATLRQDWLETVDFRKQVNKGLKTHQLSDTEWDEGHLSKRLKAIKVLGKAKFKANEPKELADEIVKAHQHNPDKLTLVVVNTVQKAVDLYSALNAQSTPKRDKKATEQTPEVLLLHSRFRPPERQLKMQRLLQMEETGGIVISTQVVEAGVDISARIMFTELSPWSSFVQRVGRCNRDGKIPDAQVFWIDLAIDTEKSAAQNAPPYAPDELKAARAELSADALKENGVGPRALRDHLKKQSEEGLKQLYPRPTGEVIRKTDVLGLFNTVTDLTGGDIDIARFIREGDERDAHVLWRDFGTDPNNPEQPAAQRDELCPVPIRKLDEFVNPKGKRKDIYRWDFLEGRWERPEKIVAGQIYLLAFSTGGYDPEIGWSPDSKNFASTFDPRKAKRNNANDKDPDSQDKEWQTLAEHVDEVVDELEAILKPEALGGLVSPEEQAVLRHAARWHDWGKAHDVFQEGLLKAGKLTRVLPDPQVDKWGKSGKSEPPAPDPQADKSAKPKRYKSNYSRPGFRHELASALGMLALQAQDPKHSDLACYLVAAHHGKVRMLIRSLSNEKRPPDDLLFARGVWENDPLPIANLGGNTITPTVTLSLEYMKSGVSAIGQPPSWVERVLNLLEWYGPFRLAYLEILLCAADRRASKRHGG